MSNKIHISEQLPEITTDIFTTATVVVGLRGSGKTSTSVVMSEQAVNHGVPVIVVDPTGVWYGLKSAPDGKSAGLPFYIFGGQHADVPLEPDAGPIIARFVVEQHVPIILDLSDLSKGKQIRFVGQFSEALYDLKARKKDPLLVIYDEAPRFIPQLTRGASPDLSICMGAVEDVFVLGRSRGLGGVLISPRLATLNKNVACAADNLIVMRSIGTPDRKAIDEWVTEAQAEQDERNELIQNMAALKQGEGYFWSPAMFNIFRRVQFGKRTTFDSSRTPKVGEKRVTPTVFAKVDIEALRGEIAATIERARADDPKALRARISQLEKSQHMIPPIAPPKIIEVPTMMDAEKQELGRILNEIDEMSTHLESLVSSLQNVVRTISKTLDKSLTRAQEVASSVAIATSPGPPYKRAQIVTEKLSVSQVRKIQAESMIGKGERSTLIVIAQHQGGVTRDQLTVITGYKRSTRDTYIQRLRMAGYVDVDGSIIRSTESGITALGDDYERLPVGADLMTYWLTRLPEGEARVLQIVASVYPKGMPRSSIDSSANFARSTRDTYLQRLRSRKLIEVSGSDVRASSLLF